jgi:hypothetical protein
MGQLADLELRHGRRTTHELIIDGKSYWRALETIDHQPPSRH